MNRLRINALLRVFLAVFLTIFFVLIGSTACANAQTENFYTPIPAKGDYLQNLSYGYDPPEVLNLCRPDRDDRAHPGIIMIHGGGWTHGQDYGRIDKSCRDFAQLGYVVADIDYRLDDLKNPSPYWPAFQIGDVQLAIRWMRYHAVELNFDPRRLCAYGTSAGAYLAVFAGTQTKIFPSDVNWIAPLESVKLSCVVDGFGPVDLTAPTYQPKITEELIGVPYDQAPSIYKDDSPLFLVNPNMPPTLAIHGTNDMIVPISQSEELVETLQQNRVPVQFLTYDGGHDFKGLDASQSEKIVDHIERFIRNQIGK